MKPTSRHERLKRFVKEAAKRLGVKPSSAEAQRTGALMLARDALQDHLVNKLVGGQNVDPTPYLRLDEAIAARLPTQSVISRVEIELVPTDSQLTMLKDECAALRAENLALKQARSGPSEAPTRPREAATAQMK